MHQYVGQGNQDNYELWGSKNLCVLPEPALG